MKIKEDIGTALYLADLGNVIGMNGIAHNKVARNLTISGTVLTITAGTLIAVGATGILIKGLLVGGMATLISGFVVGFRAGYNPEGINELNTLH